MVKYHSSSTSIPPPLVVHGSSRLPSIDPLRSVAVYVPVSPPRSPLPPKAPRPPPPRASRAPAWSPAPRPLAPCASWAAIGIEHSELKAPFGLVYKGCLAQELEAARHSTRNEEVEEKEPLSFLRPAATKGVARVDRSSTRSRSRRIRARGEADEAGAVVWWGRERRRLRFLATRSEVGFILCTSRGPAPLLFEGERGVSMTHTFVGEGGGLDWPFLYQRAVMAAFTCQTFPHVSIQAITGSMKGS
jgi:hypothetical protein